MTEISEIKDNGEFLRAAVRAHVVRGTSTISNIIAHCRQRNIPNADILEAFRIELFSRLEAKDAQADLDRVAMAINR